MDATDTTALETISHLEARLLRIEHLLCGPGHDAAEPPASASAVESLAELERRFASLLSRFRVYAELLKICTDHRLLGNPFYVECSLLTVPDRSYPDLFQPPPPSQPPTQLTPEAVRATVLACAASFPATASALSAATTDSPVPDPALSAAFVALLPRMEAVAATQRTHEADIAELRARSEKLVRGWYEGRALGYSRFVADVEGRVERVERAVRRAEKRKQDES